MGRTRAAAEAVHLLALGLWLGAVVMTGAAAAVAFPTLKGLDPSLPAYAAYPVDHWMIASGQVMVRVFAVCDAVQLGCAGVAAVTLMVGLRAARREAARGVWIARSVVVLGLLISATQHVLGPAQEMAGLMVGYWQAAQAGDAAAAEGLRTRFDAMHGPATVRMGIHASGAALAIVLAAWAMCSTGSAPRIAHGRVGAEAATAKLRDGEGTGERRPEEPALLKGRRL